jgi:hypothetical protein
MSLGKKETHKNILHFYLVVYETIYFFSCCHSLHGFKHLLIYNQQLTIYLKIGKDWNTLNHLERTYNTYYNVYAV